MTRLKDLYDSKIASDLTKEFSYKNPMAVPRMEKIVVSMGVGKAVQDKKFLELAKQDMILITGQMPVICKAKKSVSNFKVRAGDKTGLKVTLRRQRMYEFMDRLINLTIPRVRDFRGLPTKAFDGRGNYTIGIRDQLIFPEIDYSKVDKIRGMNITLVTGAKSDEEARSLLRHFGVPFRP